jgi:hypothetical protein
MLAGKVQRNNLPTSHNAVSGQSHISAAIKDQSFVHGTRNMVEKEQQSLSAAFGSSPTHRNNTERCITAKTSSDVLIYHLSQSCNSFNIAYKDPSL